MKRYIYVIEQFKNGEWAATVYTCLKEKVARSLQIGLHPRDVVKTRIVKYVPKEKK